MNVKLSFYKIVDQVFSYLKHGKESEYFILSVEDANKLYTILYLCYTGKHEISISFWDLSYKRIVFKIYPSRYETKGFDFLESQREELIKIIKGCKLSEEDLKFLEDRNYFSKQ